ncbi:hypothetical protein [Vibrio sp. ER1A]|uniref:hypothetical protein n=1 Tax=Vibrio sp. ER1A TaxID=1517681 RepID=UPI0004DD63BF|nr:hypothetical protein [Vibrio sp. ER1A]KFA99451.1 hypothetical protein HW45_03560 [Vibrio sp. ER1A]
MITKLSKQLQGKTILALANRNPLTTCRLTKEEREEVYTFKVLKVARRYMDIIELDKKFPIEGRYTADGISEGNIKSGYVRDSTFRFFESLEDIDHWKLITKQRRELADFFSRGADGLNDDQVLAIHKMIFKGDKHVSTKA